MSRDAERIDEMVALLQAILGLADVEMTRGRKVKRIDLTIERIAHWANDRTERIGERGGTSTVNEQSERKDDRAVHHQAQRDRRRLPTLEQEITRLVHEFHALVWRYTESAELNKRATVEFCANHRQHGYDVELDEHGRNSLCRDCYDFLLVHKVRPPKVLLEAKRQGRRWTVQMVEQALERKAS